MAWTTPRTWVSGEVVTAALLNTHLRDNLNAIGNAWTTYTPAWTASTTNPVINNGTLTGSYMQAGKYVTFRIRVVMGSTTTYGSGTYFFSYPFTAALVNNPGINGYVYRATSWSNFLGVGFGTDKFRMTITTTNALVTNTSPVVFANLDEIHVAGTYEAA